MLVCYGRTSQAALKFNKFVTSYRENKFFDGVLMTASLLHQVCETHMAFYLVTSFQTILKQYIVARICSAVSAKNLNFAVVNAEYPDCYSKCPDGVAVSVKYPVHVAVCS